MNRLKNETSPYLLQHADNPVDWYTWNDGALKASKSEDKPILLSIGYSSCHWCHVMAHESFEDERTAEIMNSYFINIKVDREERPDLDNIYMQAVQSITGKGGWPMTVFLLPDGRPFYGGTYFPPDNRYGLPSFKQVMDTVQKAYINRRDEVEKTASDLKNALNNNNFEDTKKDVLDPEILEQAAVNLKKGFDWKNGGFGNSPKFPVPMNLEFFLRMYDENKPETHDYLKMVSLTLEKMARGGIYDQVGGGFHRYSVDEKWLVPHFEKMLYDNAQLSRIYLHAWQFTDNEFFKNIAIEIYDYIIREMTSPEAGFYSAADADTDGMEGRFFIWNSDELQKILGRDYELAEELWGINMGPNFEGFNILFVSVEDSYLKEKFNISKPELKEKIKKMKQKLYDYRIKRTNPGCDDKIITSWNGMMLASFAEAARLLDNDVFRDVSLKAGNFILENLTTPEGKILHIYKNGTCKIYAYLEDYANVIDAFFELYKTTSEKKWLIKAVDYANIVLDEYMADNGLFYDNSNLKDDLFVRPQNLQDNAIPSGNSMIAKQFLRLGKDTGEEKFIKAGENILKNISGMLEKYPQAFGEALNAAYIFIS